MRKETISALHLFNKLPDNNSAQRFIAQKRCANGVLPPSCQAHKITTRTGAVFERPHIPLHKWPYAIYVTLTASKGISSMQLSQEVGITQKSAWFLQHRLREACIDNNTEQLSGIIEMDETYIGGQKKNKHQHKKTKSTPDRSTKTKTAISGYVLL